MKSDNIHRLILRLAIRWLPLSPPSALPVLAMQAVATLADCAGLLARLVTEI